MRIIMKTIWQNDQVLSRQITADLPEYFGLPECNEHYAIGVRARDNFAVKVGATYQQ